MRTCQGSQSSAHLSNNSRAPKRFSLEAFRHVVCSGSIASLALCHPVLFSLNYSLGFIHVFLLRIQDQTCAMPEIVVSRS